MAHRRHPRAKLTVEGRKLLVERICELGWPPARAAEAQGVSVATAYKWKRRHQAEGEAGLTDRSSRPHRSPARLSPEREQAICDRRDQHREGPHRIGWELGESQSTVHAVLRRHGRPRLCDLDCPTGTPVRYERDRPGELVHLDVKKQGRIPDGGGHRVLGRQAGSANSSRSRTRLGYDYLHIAVDDFSRAAYIEVHDNERGDTASSFVARAAAWLALHGVPIEEVLTDNGSCYRSGAFRTAVSALGAAHKRTRPYRPQTNGKAERFNATVNLEWAYARPYTSNQARLDDLPGWLHHYNHHRRHTALKGATPMDRLHINNVPGKHS